MHPRVASGHACVEMHLHNAISHILTTPNEQPAAAAYPWRRKRAIDEAIAPPPTHGNAPLRVIVEQCITDGSCFLAVFPGIQEKVVVYQQDMMGVPSACHTIEAWLVMWFLLSSNSRAGSHTSLDLVT